MHVSRLQPWVNCSHWHQQLGEILPKWCNCKDCTVHTFVTTLHSSQVPYFLLCPRSTLHLACFTGRMHVHALCTPWQTICLLHSAAHCCSEQLMLATPLLLVPRLASRVVESLFHPKIGGSQHHSYNDASGVVGSLFHPKMGRSQHHNYTDAASYPQLNRVYKFDQCAMGLTHRKHPAGRKQGETVSEGIFGAFFGPSKPWCTVLSSWTQGCTKAG